MIPVRMIALEGPNYAERERAHATMYAMTLLPIHVHQVANYIKAEQIILLSFATALTLIHAALVLVVKDNATTPLNTLVLTTHFALMDIVFADMSIAITLTNRNVVTKIYTI